MSVKTLTPTATPVASIVNQSAANSTAKLPGKNVQLAKRTYPDITHDQKFWDLAVLS